MLIYHVCCWFQVLGIISHEIVVDIFYVSPDNSTTESGILILEFAIQIFIVLLLKDFYCTIF
jgi:hypothetical protein